MHQFIFCVCGRRESSDGSERCGAVFRKVGGMCGKDSNVFGRENNYLLMEAQIEEWSVPRT